MASALGALTSCQDQPAHKQQKISPGALGGAGIAKADVAAGKPVKLYAHIFNGYMPGFSVPGIIGCDPSLVPTKEGLAMFALLPDADWREGEQYSPEHQVKAEAARRFASQYNRAMFQDRKAQILRYCPKAELSK